MIEALGPSMARTIVGDDYNDKFSYELETDAEGMRLIITDKETGESQVRVLADDDPEKSPHYSSLYDADRINAINEYNKSNFCGILLAFLSVFAVVAAALTLFLFMKVG